jgi:hypothetical protein
MSAGRLLVYRGLLFEENVLVLATAVSSCTRIGEPNYVLCHYPTSCSVKVEEANRYTTSMS